jgi:hypothetical protein
MLREEQLRALYAYRRCRSLKMVEEEVSLCVFTSTRGIGVNTGVLCAGRYSSGTVPELLRNRI